MTTNRATLKVTVLLVSCTLVALVAVRDGRTAPVSSISGGTAPSLIAEIAAGLALAVAAASILLRRPDNHAGPLLGAAALAWFLGDWNNPGTGSAITFTAGLALAALCPALVGHAALAYPNGRLPSITSRAVVALAYVVAFMSSLAQALVFDPPAEGCAQCPRNLALVGGSHTAYTTLNTWGVRLGLVAAAMLALACLRDAIRMKPSRRAVGLPVLVPAIAYLIFAAMDDAHSYARGFVGNDGIDHRIWYAQAGTLLAVALGVLSDVWRSQRVRARLARLVIDMANAPPTGQLSASLAKLLGDPTLSLEYELADGTLVDPFGRVSDGGEEQLTPITRSGATIALLRHRPGLLDDPTLQDEIARAARLSIENERLSAIRRAHLEDLRASRARIVQAGDAERRRLERDLHDGAQQRLVAMALALRLLAHRRPTDAPVIEEAEAELRSALEELREIAHGIYPALLADEGLVDALQELVERSAVAVGLECPSLVRCPEAVAAAAYFAAAAVLGSAEGPLRVDLSQTTDALRMTIDGVRGLVELIAIEDRVGALAGSVTATNERIIVEIPCVS